MRELPPVLSQLSELALDLRWSTDPLADPVWRSVDAQAWEATRNAHWLLQVVSEPRLAELASDARFVEALARLAQARAEDLRALTWCDRERPGLARQRIAYFSMEFGVTQALPNYAGGLGILAGDFLKTASDLGVPLVGVGLLFQQGYFRQTIRKDGQHECYPHNDPTALPLRPLLAPEGGWLRVPLRIARRTVWLRAWQASVGRVSLYLLDTNDPLNAPGDRAITGRLYGGSVMTRLLQEIVLGVGGVRLLEQLKVAFSVLHLNEGHSAFAVLERARAFARRESIGFRDAWWATRAGNAFTTHTSVGAAFDRFDPALVERNLFSQGGEFAELDVPPHALLALGREGAAEGSTFSMAQLALRGCSRVHGVSRAHGAVSRKLFAPLFPLRAPAEVPVDHITNGVHLPSWTSCAADALWTSSLRNWRRAGAMLKPRADSFDDRALWTLRNAQRRALIDGVRTLPDLSDRCLGLDMDVLTLGFARRFTGYKRPQLLLHDPDRLLRLLASSARPVQLLIAGKAHPADTEGKRALAAWAEFARRPDLAGRCVVLADYDMGLAARLVAGVDVWINTPSPQFEACGTSGMKVLSNGGLNLSVPDGWWAEIETPDVGWMLGGDALRPDPDDADALYDLLEREVIPAYYERDGAGLPRRWLARVRASMSQLTPRFSADRMLREYVERVYAPAAAAYEQRASSGAQLGRELARFEQEVEAAWRDLHVGPVQIAVTAGERRDASVSVTSSKDLPLELLRVELCTGLESDWQSEIMRPAHSGPTNARTFHCEIPAAWPGCTPFARVTPVHPFAELPLELPLAARSGP